MKKDNDFLKGALLSGGNVSPESILSCTMAGGSLAGVFTGALSDAAALGDTVKKGGRQTEFEKSSGQRPVRISPEEPYGLLRRSVLVAYAAAKENEINCRRDYYVRQTGRCLHGFHPGKAA